MEDKTNYFMQLLKRAYEQLADCDDTFAGDDSWKSTEHQKLMDEIADMLQIETKDRL